MGVRLALRNADVQPIQELLDDARREGTELNTQQLVISLLVMEAHSEDDCDADCLSTLELLYRLLALVADTRFQDTLRWFEPWIASIDTEGTDARRYLFFLRDIFDRAGQRHDWAAARILRSDAPEHVRAEAIVGLAQRARSAEDHARARRLFELALPMLGEHADVIDVSQLARACYVMLDFECGDRSRARLRAMPDSSEQLTRVDTSRDAARTVARDADDLVEQLARAAALATLQRNEDATALYREIADDHPGDARPHVGLAKMVFQRFGMQMFMPSDEGIQANEALHAHLEQASTRDHRDEAYYGLSTISWNFRVLASATRAALERANRDDEGPVLDPRAVRTFREELDAFCDDFRDFDAGTATAFHALGAFQLAMLSRPTNTEGSTATDVAPFLEPVRRQLESTPRNVAIYRSAIMIAMLTDDRSFIELVLAATPPETEEEEPTAGARSRASILIALRLGEPGRALGNSGDAETDTMVELIRATTPEALRDVAVRLERLAEGSDAAARLRNNAAVARHRAGETAAGLALLGQAVDDEATNVLRYNALALTPETGRDQQWVEGLTDLAQHARAAVRVQAARLLLRHRGDDASAEIVEALREADAELARHQFSDDAAFIDGYQVGIGYTNNEGITSTGKTPLPWLLVEQPTP